MDDAKVLAHIQPLFERSVVDLDAGKAKQVKELMIEYSSIFSRGLDDLGRTGMVKHHILTSVDPPIWQWPWRLHILWEEAHGDVETRGYWAIFQPMIITW